MDNKLIVDRIVFSSPIQYDPEHPACKEGHRTLRKLTKLEEKANAALNSGKWADAVKHLTELNTVDPEHIILRVPSLVKVSQRVFLVGG